MELNKKNRRQLLLIVFLSLLMAVAIFKFSVVIEGLSWILGLVMPFIIGCALAFVLNIPMSLFEKKVFTEKHMHGKHSSAFRRPLSLLCSFLIVFLLLAIISFLVVPELVNAFTILTQTVPDMVNNISDRFSTIFSNYPGIADKLDSFELNWQNVLSSINTYFQNSLSDILNSTFDTASSVVGSIANFFIGLIFAIYVLGQKEKLGRQSRSLLYTFFPEKAVDRFLEILSLINRSFYNFVTGQCTEACIWAVLFFVVLSILRFDYALTIGVLTGFLSLIPIFGAFIGGAIGVLLMLTISFKRTVFFLIVFLITQQVEGNLIYPRVVGGSVGLPGIWVLVAVAVGGSAFGIVGMLVTIPICSVIYTLLRRHIHKNLEKNNISEEKLAMTSNDLLNQVISEEKEK